MTYEFITITGDLDGAKKFQESHKEPLQSLQRLREGLATVLKTKGVPESSTAVIDVCKNLLSAIDGILLLIAFGKNSEAFGILKQFTQDVDRSGGLFNFTDIKTKEEKRNSPKTAEKGKASNTVYINNAVGFFKDDWAPVKLFGAKAEPKGQKRELETFQILDDFIADFEKSRKKGKPDEKREGDALLNMSYLLLAKSFIITVVLFRLDPSSKRFHTYTADCQRFLDGLRRSAKVGKTERYNDVPPADRKDFRATFELLLRDSGFSNAIEQQVGVSLNDLTYVYALESIKGFGPQKFKRIFEERVTPETVYEDPEHLTIFGKAGVEFRDEVRKFSDQNLYEFKYKALSQILAAAKYRGKIITYNHPNYPSNVLDSNNPIPVLYVRGQERILKESRIVACVGSRKIEPPYDELQREFVKVACADNFAIVSGFALGADTIAHETAYETKGNTLCIMPCGLDTPYPPQNRHNWTRLLEYPGAIFVSEFPFGTRVSSLTLRKRNKLIVAFARGVLIGQSAANGGAMNAYRFAREQRKPVATFSDKRSEQTSGNALIQSESRNADAVFSQSIDHNSYKQWLQIL